MSDYASKQSKAEGPHHTASSASPVPGKHTHVEHAYAHDAPVQREASDADRGGVHEAAARGTATAASALPHGPVLQQMFGRHDVSSIQAHVGPDASASASEMGAVAYATGNHVVLGAGADLFTEAHEAAHVVQQRGGVQLKSTVGEAGDPHEQHADQVASYVVQGRSAEALLDRVAPTSTGAGSARDGASPIQRQAATGAAAAASAADSAATVDPAADPPPMGAPPSDFGSDIETTAVERQSTAGVVDVPIASIYGRHSPYRPFASVTKGTVLQVKGFIPAKTPVYVVLYDGLMTKSGSRQVECLARLLDLAVSDKGPAKPEKSTTMASNDWMSLIPSGDPNAIISSLAAIVKARDAIGEANIKEVKSTGPTVPRDGYRDTADDRTAPYEAWLHDEKTMPRLSTGKDDVRWQLFKKFFPAEGSPAAVMTYDHTNITWGVGFAGKGGPGVGQTEQMMSRLFNQSPDSRDAFWRAGVTVVGTELYVVNVKDAATGQADKLQGTAAEGYLREQKKLLSLMTNVARGFTDSAQKTPDRDMRQDSLDAQFETFLNNTLSGSGGIIEGMTLDAATLAAHARHTGQHDWGEFRGAHTKADAELKLKTRIKELEDKKAAGDKTYSYIYPFEDIAKHL